MVYSPPRSVATIRLPDLASLCPFPVRYNNHVNAIEIASDTWFENGFTDLTMRMRKDLKVLKSCQLTAHCYTECDQEHLRIIADFMNYLFHLDDISDGMMTHGTESLADVVMNAHWFPSWYRPTHAPGKAQPDQESNAGKMSRDYWSRFIEDAGPGVQARFCESMEAFFEAVGEQARDRSHRVIPDLKTYMTLRRDTSGCRMAFDMLEYGLRIDLPEFVHGDPIVRQLKLGANDVVGCINDILSYGVEQSRGDTHNIVSVIMHEHNIDVQRAVNYAGELTCKAMGMFCENKARLPSWGPEIDDAVAGYVRGLQDWMVGSLHWSFVTERYFGRYTSEAKQTGLVRLLPKRTPSNAA